MPGPDVRSAPAAERVMPFDALASEYDDAFTSSPLGRVLRAAVWRRLQRYTVADGLALDLGCGTGADTEHLASSGMRVVAVDASASMVQAARRRCLTAGLDARVEHGDLNRLPSVPGVEGPFDLVLSDFGALSCADDLPAVLSSIESRLAEEGHVVVVIMGRVVPWEWLWMLACGRPSAAFRRLASSPVRWRGIEIRYHTPASLRRAARAAGLRVVRLAALGALLPITEAGPWIARHPRLLAGLDRLERRLEAVPPLPWLADHVMVELGRR